MLFSSHFYTTSFSFLIHFSHQAINQNEGSDNSNDLNQLQEVVADACQTLMVIDNEGSALTRIWCLFEVKMGLS